MSNLYHSEILGLDYAKGLNSENVYFKDNSLLDGKPIKYTPEERQIIYDTGGEITKTIHLVKSIFGGEVVRAPAKKEFKDKYNMEFF